MTLAKKTRAAFVWSFLRASVMRLLTLMVFLILARQLGPSEFGLVALASVFVSFSNTIVRGGFSQAIVRLDGLTDGHLNTVFWINLGLGLAFTLGLYFGAEVLSTAFSQPDLTYPLRVIAFSVLIGSLSAVQMALMERNLEFKKLAYRDTLSAAIAGVAAVYLAFNGYGVWALVLQALIAGLIKLILLWGVSSWRPKVEFDAIKARELFAFGKNALGVSLLTECNRKIDDLLIGSFLGSIALGIYSLAYRLHLTLVTLVIKSVTNVIFPLFSKMQGNMDRLRAGYYLASNISAVLLIPIFVLLIITAPNLIPIICGPKWVDSIPVFQALMLANIGTVLNINNSKLMMALGHSGVVFRQNIVMTVLTVTMFFIALRWGVVAVALAYALRSLFAMPAMLYWVRKYADIEPWVVLKCSFPAVAAAVVMYIAVYLPGLYLDVDTELGLAALPVKVVIAMMSYIGALLIFDRSVVQRIKSVIKR